MKFGIFGLIGSGKTTAVEYLEDFYSFEVLNLDKISKIIMDQEDSIAFVRNNIPEAYEVKTKTINRSKLREILFTNKKVNKDFARVIWPKIAVFVNQVLETLPQQTNVIIEGAILPVLKLNLDHLILIEARKKFLLSRVSKRDHRSFFETRSLLKIQKQWIKKSEFDNLITNDGTVKKLYDKLDLIMKKNKIKKSKRVGA